MFHFDHWMYTFRHEGAGLWMDPLWVILWSLQGRIKGMIVDAVYALLVCAVNKKVTILHRLLRH